MPTSLWPLGHAADAHHAHHQEMSAFIDADGPAGLAAEAHSPTFSAWPTPQSHPGAHAFARLMHAAGSDRLATSLEPLEAKLAAPERPGSAGARLKAMFRRRSSRVSYTDEEGEAAAVAHSPASGAGSSRRPSDSGTAGSATPRTSSTILLTVASHEVGAMQRHCDGRSAAQRHASILAWS